MTSDSCSVNIHWSYWKNETVVSWTANGVLAEVALNRPPISVAHLPSRGVIAVAGSFDEFNSKNLLFYSYDGVLEKTFCAPSLGRDTHFGGIAERPTGLRVIIGFYIDDSFTEQAGWLNTDDGAVTGLHRNY